MTDTSESLACEHSTKLTLLRHGTATDVVKVLSMLGEEGTVDDYRLALSNALDRIAVLEGLYDELHQGLWKSFKDAGQLTAEESRPESIASARTPAP